MIIVVMVIAIAVIAVGVYIATEWSDGFELIFYVCGLAGIVAVLIGGGISVNNLVQMRVVDDKIEILQAENEAIEQQIAVIVKEYQEHEKEVFSEVSPDSAIQLVTLYPELKSDTLVARQMEIYYANHEALRDLKLSKANESVYKWWLYFGG